MGKKNLLDYFTPQKGKKRKQSGKTKKRKATRSRSSNIETAKREAVGEFYEWESLSARIGPLTRIRTISGPTIAVLLFKEAPISLKNHRLIVVGFIRCESCNEIYPDVIDLVIKYSYEYPFKLRNGLELSSAMFGKAKADGSGLEHYLKKWKDTMHA
eukprot:1153617_1